MQLKVKITRSASLRSLALSNAKKTKQDEFYTQLGDIENELKYYKSQLRGKTILCNCDDPFESNFFRYFALNFNTLGLKKLIATSYVKSPIVGGQLILIHSGTSAPLANSQAMRCARVVLPSNSYRGWPESVLAPVHGQHPSGVVVVSTMAQNRLRRNGVNHSIACAYVGVMVSETLHGSIS